MLGAADGLGEEDVRTGEIARWAVTLSAPPLAQLPGLSPGGVGGAGWGDGQRETFCSSFQPNRQPINLGSN